MRATRVAIALVFFADGLLLGSWAARIPAVQHHAALRTAQLGVALFAMSARRTGRDAASRAGSASAAAAAP